MANLKKKEKNNEVSEQKTERKKAHTKERNLNSP
jgi:hypothetical protein